MIKCFRFCRSIRKVQIPGLPERYRWNLQQRSYTGICLLCPALDKSVYQLMKALKHNDSRIFWSNKPLVKWYFCFSAGKETDIAFSLKYNGQNSQSQTMLESTSLWCTFGIASRSLSLNEFSQWFLGASTKKNESQIRRDKHKMPVKMPPSHL